MHKKNKILGDIESVCNGGQFKTTYNEKMRAMSLIKRLSKKYGLKVHWCNHEQSLLINPSREVAYTFTYNGLITDVIGFGVKTGNYPLLKDEALAEQLDLMDYLAHKDRDKIKLL